MLWKEDDALLAKHLLNMRIIRSVPFTALNTAFIQHGTYIHVPKNTVIEKPINILYLSKESNSPLPLTPETLSIMA